MRGSPVADAGRVQGWRMAKVVVRSRTNQGGREGQRAKRPLLQNAGR
jgi:hypothetical protein